MRIKKTAIAIMMFSAIAMIAGVNFAGAQVYVPLVQIPGLPPGAVNLSMYLVGLYDFLLSIVGIVAVMMLIIGGMRYITAAGNQAAVSDAKDIITNALAGLLLAILSWVIVAEINPDVLYIKKPGAGFTSEDNVDWGACGQYNPDMATCICKDTVDISAAAITSQELCDRECRLQDHCMIEGAQCFIREDINGPNFYSSSDNEALGQDGECYCLSGMRLDPTVNGHANCEETCAADIEWGNVNMPPCIRTSLCVGFDPGIYTSCTSTCNIDGTCFPGVDAYDEFVIELDEVAYFKLIVIDPKDAITYPVEVIMDFGDGSDPDGDGFPGETIIVPDIEHLNNITFLHQYAISTPLGTRWQVGAGILWNDARCTLVAFPIFSAGNCFAGDVFRMWVDTP